MKNDEVYAFNSCKYMLPKLCSYYDKDCNINIRKNRFLAIEERVKYYIWQQYNNNNEIVFHTNFCDNFE